MAVRVPIVQHKPIRFNNLETATIGVYRWSSQCEIISENGVKEVYNQFVPYSKFVLRYGSSGLGYSLSSHLLAPLRPS